MEKKNSEGQKVHNNKKENLLTHPNISNRNIKIKLTVIQKNILKYLKDEKDSFTVKGCARYFNMLHHNTVNYHLKKMLIHNLVEKDGIWKITNAGIQYFSRGKTIVYKGGKTVYKDSVHLQKTSPKNYKLTETENKIWNLLTRKPNPLKPSEIALKLRCSKSNISNNIARIKKKGWDIKGGKNIVYKVSPTCSPFAPHEDRLHGQHFKLLILKKTEYFINLYKSTKGNILKEIEGHTVVISKNTINIHCNKEKSWFNKDPNLAHAESLQYWYKFFSRLESKLNIKVRGVNENIEEVIAHYGDINNEIAKKLRLERKKLQVRASEDGKVWLIGDLSWIVDEMETVKAGTSQDDADLIFGKIMNNYRDNPDKIMTPTEITENISMLLKAISTMENKFSNHIFEVSNSHQDTIKLLNGFMKIMLPRKSEKIQEKNIVKHEYGSYFN